MRHESKDYNFSVKTKKYGNDIEYVVIFDDFPNVIGAGDTISEAIEEGKDNLDAYISYCYENGIEVPEPTCFDFKRSSFSGKINLRMSKSLHERVTAFSELEGVSINTFIIDSISEHISSIKDKGYGNILSYFKALSSDQFNVFINLVDNDSYFRNNWSIKKIEKEYTKVVGDSNNYLQINQGQNYETN